MRTLLSALFLVAVSAPAFAFHGPADVKATDAGLGKLGLSSPDKAQVMSLRNLGDARHKASRHKELIGDLDKAMRIMLNSGS